MAVRKVAQWLVGAAENDLHQGRLEEALQNLEALGALARMERDEYTLVAQMIRVAVAGLGVTVTWDALQVPGWTEPQLERMQRAWEQVDLVEAVQTGLVGERAGGVQLFTWMRHASGLQAGRLLFNPSFFGWSPARPALEEVLETYLLAPTYKLAWINEDELFFLRSMQEGLGPVRLLKEQRSWVEARAGVTNAVTRLNRLLGWPSRYRYLVSSMAIPNYARAVDRAVQAETERQMTLAAIALKRFHVRHSNWPPSLGALVPEFLAAVPYDYMSAKPLCYHPMADAGYVLYSVGEDGKDDGGDPTPPPGTAPGLWTGRDAVWPSLVSGPSEPAPQPVRY